MTMETFTIIIKERPYHYTCSLDEDADVIAENLLKPVFPDYTPDYIGIRAVTVAQIQRAQLRLARQRIDELLESQERTIKYFNDTTPKPSKVYSPQKAVVDSDESSSRSTWRDVLSPPQSLQTNAADIDTRATKQLLLAPQQNSRNKYHGLLTFPLSEVVENRIVAAIFDCYRENQDQLDVPVSDDQLTLEWFYTAITEVAQRINTNCDKRAALDEYLERILVPSAHELGLLPFSIIALDKTLFQMGDRSSHFRDVLSRYSKQIHEWFMSHANYESPSPSPSSSSLKNSNNSIQKKRMFSSPPSSAKKEKQRLLVSSLSLDINTISDKKDGNACLFFAPMHSPTKLTTRAVFLDESTEVLKERARWFSSRSSPSKNSHEMKLIGEKFQRDDQRRGKLTKQSILPDNRSPTKCSSSPINHHSTVSPSSLDVRMHHRHTGHDSTHKHKHVHDDEIAKEMRLDAFVRFLESTNAIPDLIERREAENIFLEMTWWNHHHPDLLYSVLDASSSSAAAVVAQVTDTIPLSSFPVGDPDVTLTLPERGFAVTLAVIATYCFSHVSLGEVRLENLLKELGNAER